LRMEALLPEVKRVRAGMGVCGANVDMNGESCCSFDGADWCLNAKKTWCVSRHDTRKPPDRHRTR